MRAGELSVRSVIDAVEAELREQILDQEIPMGVALRETEVARTFDVARPTAKAAIERLVSSGLLRRDAHRSARVPVLSAKDVQDLYFTRIVLESQIARRLATDANYPAAADDAIAALQALGTSALPARYVGPDIAFHTALTRRLRSHRINELHDRLMQEMHFCMAQVQAHNLLSPAVIASEHERIATAIRKQDPDAAEWAVSDHLNRACEALTTSLTERKHTHN